MSARISGMAAAQTGVMALAFAAWMALWLASAATPLATLPASSLLETWRALCASGAAQASLPALFAMWVLMSVAMMLPTALPLVRGYAGLPGEAGRHVGSLVAGYLLVWLGFSLAASLVQWLLAGLDLLTVSGDSRQPLLDATLLATAGAYQFSALRAGCLSRCRAPLTFLMQHWCAGRAGALGVGLRHGLDCLGCCWALMALAFVGGTMNLAWMGAATLLMALEKLPEVGRRITVPLGAGLLLAAAFVAGRAAAGWL